MYILEVKKLLCKHETNKNNSPSIISRLTGIPRPKIYEKLRHDTDLMNENYSIDYQIMNKWTNYIDEELNRNYLHKNEVETVIKSVISDASSMHVMNEFLTDGIITKDGDKYSLNKEFLNGEEYLIISNIVNILNKEFKYEIEHKRTVSKNEIKIALAKFSSNNFDNILMSLHKLNFLKKIDKNSYLIFNNDFNLFKLERNDLILQETARKIKLLIEECNEKLCGI